MKLSGAAIRARFIEYFSKTLGHQHLPSASLIPSNPTVLLTPAGMLPFVNIFLGIEPPLSPPRAVTVQKCARVSGKASDLSYVGRTSRHHTFFEMLGNFSFGDYFKADVIPWAWTFVTQELGMPVERLWVTVHHTDAEARRIWQDVVGLPQERVISRGDKDNFWGPPGPTGPCGPCTEIFFDRGPQYGEQYNMTEDEGDRFVEIWNLVFMELFQDGEGKRSGLESKNVDTGMGLERVAMVLQEVENTFETDLLFPLVKKVGDLTGHRYHQNDETDVALKIVADHIRCVTFALADGIIPSNEGRGYVIRMILRRAVRYAKKLGLTEPMLFKLVSSIRDLYQEAYPELKERYSVITETLKAEEKRFLETLERGSRLFEEAMAHLASQKKTVLSGETVFKLYDTYGFPSELTEELAQERGVEIDWPGFEAAMGAQRDQARAAQGDKTVVEDQVFAEILKEHGATTFLGYDSLEATSQIVALLVEGKRVDTVGGTNQSFELILDQTPFYGESGGQSGDQGILYVPQGQHAQTIVVKDTQKVGDLFIHKCLFDQGGQIQVGQTVTAEVTSDLRQKVARHHSATHLLHAALKKRLGSEVSQAGSWVGPNSARFDFNFQRALTPTELRQIEMLVNQWVLENVPREVALMDPESAKAQGAIAMFNEKYGDTVRVVRFGPVSTELCGGTHVERLGDIGLIKITHETAIAAGIRRIEFVAGEAALFHMESLEMLLDTTAKTLKIPAKEIPERLERLLDEKKQAERALKTLQEQLAMAQVKDLIAQHGQSPVGIISAVEVPDAEPLKFMADTLVQQCPSQVIFLGANVAGKALFIAAVPQALIKQGLSAGNLVKLAASLCEGGGGGKPAFAQAGGKLGQNVPQALEAVRQHLTQNLTPSPTV